MSDTDDRLTQLTSMNRPGAPAVDILARREIRAPSGNADRSELAALSAEEQALIADMAGGQVPGSVGQENVTPPATPSPAANRGRPHPNFERLRKQWAIQGRARLASFVDQFGDDALVLGPIVFEVPPLAIRIMKGNMIYKWKPLRTNDAIAVPSGQGECSIEIDLIFEGLNQINRCFSPLVGLFRKSPFAFIENKLIRNMMCPDNPEKSMMVRLENLVIDVMSGKPRAIFVTLQTNWFNYDPFCHQLWFRESWGQRSANSPAPSPPTTPPTGQTPESETEPIQQVGQIVSTTQLQSIHDADISRPLEARIDISDLQPDTRDPLVQPTSPVVWPFNSEPYVNYIYSETDRAHVVDEWNDNLEMKWSSYTRIPLPRNWSTQSAPSTSSERRRVEEGRPPPPPGGKNVILFVGDVVVAKLLGVTGTPGSTISSVQTYSAEGRFPKLDGFEYFYAQADEVNMVNTANWFSTHKGDSQFTQSGGSPGSKLAAVIAPVGIHNAITTTTEENAVYNAVTFLKQECEGAQCLLAAVIPMPFILTTFDFTPQRMQELCNHMVALETRTSNQGAIIINSHTCLAEQQDFMGTFRENYAQDDPSNPGRFLPEPTADGYERFARFINERLPWASVQQENQPQMSGTWTLAVNPANPSEYIHDGDTIFATSATQTTALAFRLNFIDAPEIAQAPWGEQSRDALIAILGPVGSSFEWRDRGTDVHGRRVGEVFKGSMCVNIEMVERGMAFVYERYAHPQEQVRYYQAQARASENRVGIWSDSNLARPQDFRSDPTGAAGDD